MSIREEIKAYIDGNGLVAPNTVGPNVVQGSDNGPMYTSEYYVILKKSGLLTDQDKVDYANKIGSCINKNLLNRVPTGQNDGQEGPDDYYGVLNACYQLGNTSIPQEFLKAVIEYKGSLDNVNPGSWQWGAVLIRQPQLLASLICASFPSLFNPFHWLVRLACFPFFVYSALVIAVSCIKTPVDQADPRRLAWHLIQVISNRSLLCKIASLLWYNRLRGGYGDAEMKGVASYYYQAGHPFIKYWVS